MSDTKLKPCPFCGCDRLKYNEKGWGWGFYIECGCCKATGSKGRSSAEAESLWNIRKFEKENNDTKK